MVAAMSRKSLVTSCAPPDGAEPPLLQDTQEGLLDGHRKLADLVQEKRASVRLLDQAVPGLVGAGEGAPDMPEEGALDEGFGQGGAVDHDEIPVGPGAVLMDGPGEQLLARARFPRDQDVGVARGRLGQRVQAGPELRAVADDPSVFRATGFAGGLFFSRYSRARSMESMTSLTERGFAM